MNQEYLKVDNIDLDKRICQEFTSMESTENKQNTRKLILKHILLVGGFANFLLVHQTTRNLKPV